MNKSNLTSTLADTKAIADGLDRQLTFDNAPLKDLLLKENTRKCKNAPMIIIFWAHIFAICGLIIHVMTHQSTAASVGALGFLVKFVAESEVGQKLFGVMMWTCITGGLFAAGWIWFLRYWADKSITISIVIAHIIVLPVLILAIYSGDTIIVIFCVIVLLANDAWLYCNRQDFPFSEMMMKIGTKCVSQNSEIQCFAYAFMPVHITTYIFWLLGLLYCFAFEWGVKN